MEEVAVATGSGLVLVLPLAAVLLSTNAGGRPLLAQTSMSDLLRDLAGIAPTRSGVLQALILVLCGVGVVVIYLRQRRQNGEPARLWHYALLLCWLLIPIALGAVISLMWPIFVTRYFIVCLPALVMLVAVGLGIYYAQDHKEGENWRGLVQHVAEEAQRGDRVLFLSRFSRRPFEYYLERPSRPRIIADARESSMPWGEYPPVVAEAQVGATSTTSRELEADEPARVWVVLLWGGFRTGDDNGAPFQQVLMRHYVETDHLFFGRYLKLGLFEHR